MNRDEREQMVDRLLNQALSQQEIEPRAGLEQRILANLRTQPQPRPWWWGWLCTAGAVAASVLLFIALKPTRPVQPVKAPVAVEQRPVAPAPANAAPSPPAIVAKGRRPSRKSLPARTITAAKANPVEPRQPVFAPARLTEAERALVAMLRSNPDEAKLAVERQQQARQEADEFMEQAFKPRQ